MKSGKKQKTINISNALNRAGHRLALNQKRLLMLAISELDSRGCENAALEIKAVDFANEYQIDTSTAYTELSKACKGIMRKPPISIQMDGFVREIHWTEYCDYYTSSGKVFLKFTEKIAPHLTQLESQFTKYKLSRVTGFRSTYSWKLFELIMQFKRTGLLRISKEEFADSMEASATHRKDFGAMRRRIIDPAIKEIREKDGLEISYTVTKRGRQVTGLEFTFPPEQQKALPLDKPKKKPTGKPKVTKAYIEQHALPGESYDQARARLETEIRRSKAA